MRDYIRDYSRNLALAAAINTDKYHYQHNITMKDLIRIIIAILLPPLGVFLQVGLGKDFWINILLTLLGYVPGLVHAIWIIAKK